MDKEADNNMKKTTSKKAQNSNYHRDFANVPEIIGMETLSYASDHELERHFTYLTAERDRAARSDQNLQPWEVEICYLQRELKIRSDRRAAHAEYLRRNPDANFFVGVADNSSVPN
jgi:hypothetical protein